MNRIDLKKLIVSVNDWPKPGVKFLDISPLIASGKALKQIVEELSAFAKTLSPDLIIAPESRGFIIGAPVAAALGIGFVAARKPAKLPRQIFTAEYSLEYGKNSLSIQQDAIAKGARVLIIDDILATGGTIHAIENLLEQIGAVSIGYAFLINLKFLKGEDKLNNQLPSFSVIEY